MTYTERMNEELRKLLAEQDEDAILEWVRLNLLASYRNGIAAGQKGAKPFVPSKSRSNGSSRQAQ